MKNLKKKCWREKVTAEITLAHLQRFAAESGSEMSSAEVAAFLNQDGRAHDLWLHMMQAGEDYIKSILGQSALDYPPVKAVSTHSNLVH
jgi:hypothetical protein